MRDASGNFFGPTQSVAAVSSGLDAELCSNFRRGGVKAWIYDFPEPPTRQSELVEDAGGYLYGTTRYDTPAGYVYKIAPDHTETVIHNFKKWPRRLYPTYGLVADRTGNFYGATSQGGSNNCAAVDVERI